MVRVIVAILWSSFAFADITGGVGPKCANSTNLACATTAGAIGIVAKTCTGGQLLNSVDSSGNFNCTAGSGLAGSLGVNTCMPITAGQTLYMGAGSCVDASEAIVMEPAKNTLTLSNMSCTSSAALVSGSITVQGRAGACGSLADTSGFTCVINNGTPVCNSGANLLNVTAGQCFSFKVTTVSIPSAVAVTCTLERTG